MLGNAGAEDGKEVPPIFSVCSFFGQSVKLARDPFLLIQADAIHGRISWSGKREKPKGGNKTSHYKEATQSKKMSFALDQMN